MPKHYLPLFVALLMSATAFTPAHAEETAAEKAEKVKEEFSKAAEVVKSGAEEMKKPKLGQPVNSELLQNAPLPTDFLMGKKEAPVTIVEYASLTCPHCAHFHTAVLPIVEKEYIETGKVRYILRPFPLNEAALKASSLVDCIGEEGGAARYYIFVKVLFDAQSKWAFDSNYLTSLETFAAVGGVPKETFKKCTADDERDLKILNMRKAATDELKIDHTPYVFIDNVPYNGPPSADNFKAALDSALAKK